jgi:recombinational DNA repair protein RecT
MAKKTVIKLNLSRNAPLSVEMQDAIKADQSVMYEADKYEYTDSMEQQIVDAQKAQEVANKFADFDDVTDKKEDKK